MFIDYYEILEISPNANSETVERIFRYLAMRYHPDNRETGDGEPAAMRRRKPTGVKYSSSFHPAGLISVRSASANRYPNRPSTPGDERLANGMTLELHNRHSCRSR